jgi:hypothetical protein
MPLGQWTTIGLRVPPKWLATCFVHSNLAERPLQATFGARAVVSDDVEDQGVVQLSGLIEAVDHAADLVVGKGEVAGVVFHQPGVHTFRVGRLIVPGGNFLRPRSELCPFWNDPEFELPGVGYLALLVPPVIELALELVAPFFRSVMRGMRCRGGVIHEPRFVLIGGACIPHPGDGLVGHVGGEVVALLGRPRLRH